MARRTIAHLAIGAVLGASLAGTFALAAPGRESEDVRVCVTRGSTKAVTAADRAGKCPGGSKPRSLQLQPSGGPAGPPGPSGPPGEQGPAGPGVATSGPDVVLLGHSMMVGAASRIASSLSSVNVTNLAVNGESLETISARWGGQPLRVTLPASGLPASGPVVVELQNGQWPLLQGPSSYRVEMVAGDGLRMPGTFAVTRAPDAQRYVHSEDDVYTFTRTEPGDPIAVVGEVPLYYQAAEDHLDDIAIYWAARNGSWVTAGAVEERLELTAAMIGRQSPIEKRFLILGELTSTTEVSSGPGAAAIGRYNAQAGRLYGRRFIDVRDYLLRFGLAAAGLPETEQDRVDIRSGLVPSSLRADGLHLNDAGNALVAQLIRDRLLELGWYNN